MLLSPAVKASYLNTMASGSSPTAKRRNEADDDTALVSQLAAKRARPMMPLRGSKSMNSASGTLFNAGLQPAQTSFNPIASSSDVTLDYFAANANQSDLAGPAASLGKGKSPEVVASPVSSATANVHWLKVVTSYGYTFVRSDELHLVEGNSDVQMVVDASPASSSQEAPSSPHRPMVYPLPHELPPTPSPSDDGAATPANRYLSLQHADKPMWEHVEGDQAGSINEMMMDDW